MASVSEEVRTRLRHSVTCSCCGSRLVTIAELTAALRELSDISGTAPKITEAVVSTFLRGGTVRSDVLDVMSKYAGPQHGIGADAGAEAAESEA